MTKNGLHLGARRRDAYTLSGRCEVVGDPPKNGIDIRAKEIQIPEPEKKWIKVLDRVSGQKRFRYAPRE